MNLNTMAVQIITEGVEVKLKGKHILIQGKHLIKLTVDNKLNLYYNIVIITKKLSEPDKVKLIYLLEDDNIEVIKIKIRRRKPWKTRKS